ncbi:MAG: RsmB/NOP family class I SAM-dependent RNA methyltransferase [Thermoplasmatota archaeon]
MDDPPAGRPLPPVARFPSTPKVREWARQHRYSEPMVARLARVTPHPARFLEGLERRPPRYLRVNPLRGTVKEVRQRLEARGFELTDVDLDPSVLRVGHAPISPGATLEHLLGMTTPQDLASASAPLALAAQPGEVVADLAAAPGVKTLHLAGDVGPKGAVVAVDPDPARCRALRFNLERGGATNTVVRCEPAQELPGEAWADRVLLDAPCTGEGTLPKDRSRRKGTPDEVGRLAALQRELVDAADRVLKPGGHMVYATCTYAPEENEAQVQRLLDRGYEILDLPFDRCDGTPLLPGLTEWPGYELDDSVTRLRRFTPGLHPTLGFSLALLRKPVRAGHVSDDRSEETS